MKPLVGIIMGSSSDWETMRAAAEALDKLGVALRNARRLRAPHARPAVRIRRDRAAARHRSHHRRRRRRRPSTRHDGVQDHAAGARRAGAVEDAERSRFAAVDRADAGGHSGRHVRDRRRGRHERRARRRRHPRQQASRDRRGAQEIPRRADGQEVLEAAIPTVHGSPQDDHRHRRRRPARAHDGARRLSARLRVPVPRSRGAHARRPGRPDPRRRAHRPRAC